MKKIFTYITLLSFILSQTYFALPPIQMSARNSFKELGRSEAYYEVIINRRGTLYKFVHDHAIKKYITARDDCTKHQHVYIQKLIGHRFRFTREDYENPLVKEASQLFEEIKLYFMYRRLIKKVPDVYQKLLDISPNIEEIHRLSNPDFIKNKFV